MYNCVHILFKIWYMSFILSYLLFSAVHIMQGFVYEKMLYSGTRITLRTEVLSQEMKTPCISTFKRTQMKISPEYPSFGSIGLYVVTISLLPTASEGSGGTDCSIAAQIKSQITFSSYKLGRKVVRPSILAFGLIGSLYASLHEWRYFETFKEPRNWIQGIDSDSLCSLSPYLQTF